MNKTKKIYFLSALVMIIGCYALNLSYSLFVQTEEREAVESVVPSLSSSLSIPNITLGKNEEYIIKETITNTGTVSMNYAINSIGENYQIKLVEKDDNSLFGTLEPDASKDIYLYIKNESEEENIVNFIVNSRYTTLTNDLTSNIDTNEYVAKKTAIPYYDKENTLAYNIINNYIGEDTTEDSLLMYEEIEELTKNNNKLLLPIYNDDVVSSTEGNLYKTKDNYGISYYYIGNVTNNYVNIKDHTWRIVRINGDGTVRLISNDIIDTTIYNDIDKDNSYNGTIKETIDKWYENNLFNYSELLSDEIYCVSNKETFDIEDSLICNEDNIYNVDNEKMKYPIGLLSVEEAVFAGVDSYLSNKNIWTMSSYKDNEIFVINDNKIETSSKNEEYGIKPVINIKLDVLVESGNGTEFNPYIITND